MPTSYMSSSIRELVKYGLRGSDGQEVMKCISVWFGFQIKVEWESCGRDGCGEEDGDSRVRRWRHLKFRGHQGLWNGKVVN